MNERLKELRKFLNLSQKEFGERIGLKVSAISYLESGKSSLTESNIKLICQVFNVSREWLLNGSGEMFLKSEQNTIEKLSAEYHLSELERKLLENYLKLSEPDRQELQRILKAVFSAPESLPNYKTMTTAEAEELYRRSLFTAPNTGLSVSNTTEEKTVG